MTATASNTFSSASSDVSTYKEVAGASQNAARFGVNVPGNSGNPTLELALVDVDGGTTRVLARYTATATVATTRRTGSDGASGDYCCDLAFSSAEGGGSRFDLLGHSELSAGKSAVWKVGITALAGQASALVWWQVDDEI